MTDNQRFLYLLAKYRNGNCSAEESDEFFSLLLSDGYDDVIKQQISDDFFSDIKTSGDLPPHVAQEIIRNILSADHNMKQMIPARKKSALLYKWVAAACIVALAVLITVLYLKNEEPSRFASIIPESDIVKENKTTEVLKEVLSDGSVIVLQPGSKIFYPPSFAGNKREVYLQGDAHFDVSHDAEKPFLVYCNDLVTKVLGTSFDIYTNAANGDVEVAVRTGRVQVYHNNEIAQEKSITTEAVILNANQRVVYSIQSGKILPTLVQNPLPVIKTKPGSTVDSVWNNESDLGSHASFIYDQQTLDVVFDDIQKVYGIEVVVENSNLYNCVFTGDVSNKDLFVLLKIICLSTSSDYEIMGTKIFVKGKGCLH